MTPPKLAGDTPVANIFQPVIIGLNPAIWIEFDLSAVHSIKRRLGQGFHFDEPLLGQAGFDRNMSALTVTNLMNMIFYFIQ